MADNETVVEQADVPASDEPTPGRNLASIYCNRFHILMGDRLTRLTFGDSMDGGDDLKYFMAIMMDTETALELARVINQVAADRAEAKEKAAAALQGMSGATETN